MGCWTPDWYPFHNIFTFFGRTGFFVLSHPDQLGEGVSSSVLLTRFVLLCGWGLRSSRSISTFMIFHVRNSSHGIGEVSARVRTQVQDMGVMCGKIDHHNLIKLRVRPAPASHLLSQLPHPFSSPGSPAHPLLRHRQCSHFPQALE